MKEFEYIFDLEMMGLRQFRTNKVDEEALVDCFNLMPMRGGHQGHEVLLDLNGNSIAWGGLGQLTASANTTNITIKVSDYMDDTFEQTVSVYIDNVLQGTTDAQGEIDIADIAVGGHTLKLTKASYTDSDADDLLNDYIVVT